MFYKLVAAHRPNNIRVEIGKRIDDGLDARHDAVIAPALPQHVKEWRRPAFNLASKPQVCRECAFNLASKPQVCRAILGDG